ncbi:flagellar protein FliO/FliZ [Desulfuromusa kysingii]|uniref:Flagellar protein FliO/FliZ n=1 Tax=Desulfuromusa kysingii TaxID=37625 RepID=A0A1H3VGV8_9BACT|nr:flagellar biosynthetic protein FliO [Desulfuromusa kysingii]SDZ73999.1 flagellar protein FliO/FliZ [Desulfuromusa kysingii]
MRWFFITFIFIAQPVFAATNAAEPSLLGSSLKMVAALGVVIGLLLLIYAASRKGFGILPHKRNGLIEVLETRPLGGRKFLCVVKVRGQEMLLGLSNDRIECLSKLTADAKFAETLQQVEEDQS